MQHSKIHQGDTVHSFWVVAVVTALMFSCSVKRTEKAGYFAVDSLLHAQVNILHSYNATIRKTASLGDTSDVNTYKPGDTIAWKNELAILSEIDAINKPTNKGLYLVDKALTDPRSNLKVNVFTATENLPVHSLRIFYHNSPANIRKIEAVLREDHSLYTSRKNLNLEFQDIDQHIVLTGFSVSGMQKMYLKDSVQYSIAVAITLAN
jgi:hypothetical protein